MDFNILSKVLFPAPKPAHYTHESFPGSLFFLPKTERTEAAIPCLLVKHRYPADALVIFAHGNGCDIGSMEMTLRRYGAAWQVHILLFEYPGYGANLGQPSEAAINANIREVYNFVNRTLEIPTSRIILYGQSIGTGPVCHMAALLNSHNVRLGGIILQSPYTCISALVEHFGGQLAAQLFEDRWRNVDEVKSMIDPLLIIHGKKDGVIPWRQAEKLYKKCKSGEKHLLLANRATHNEFNHLVDIVNPIKLFIQQYLRLSPQQQQESQRPGPEHSPPKPLPEAKRQAINVKIDEEYFNAPLAVRVHFDVKLKQQLQAERAAAEETAAEEQGAEDEEESSWFSDVMSGFISDLLYGDENDLGSKPS
jgi:fermentation-respiration switch protein FrsA (DUF1100 family)